MALRSIVPSSGSSAMSVAETIVDGLQLGIGLHKPDHLLLDLSNPASEDGDQRFDVGTNISVGGLFKPGLLLFTQVDELSSPDRLCLESSSGLGERHSPRRIETCTEFSQHARLDQSCR